ncbi:SDR family oxidoreductase [Parasphingopyxis marina]|nr:SDR family oxidoreductase [Parasphingopyxis marina]
MDTSRKVLVVTGGSRGIGLATAERFAVDGYDIVNISRTPTPMEGATQIEADLIDPNWADAARDVIAKALAGADSICLVHNSALQVPGEVSQVDIEGFRNSCEINVVAPAILNLMVLPAMGRGSSIIYIGSTMSKRATRGLTSYIATKHAVVGLMKATAQDLGGTGIHTACVCPGFTNTEMLQKYGGEAMAHLASKVHENRLIEPAEIAETIFFAANNPVLNGSVVEAENCFIEP